MNQNLQESFDLVLQNWKQMQTSDADHAEDDANRFENSFYQFIEQFTLWFKSCPHRTASLDEALALSEVVQILDQLPSPLYLPFETELELLLEGIERESDSKYD